VATLTIDAFIDGLNYTKILSLSF